MSGKNESKSNKGKIIGWVLGLGSVALAIFGIIRLRKEPKDNFEAGEFSPSGVISLTVVNKTNSTQTLTVFRTPVQINPNLQITGGDIGIMSQQVVTQPIKLKKLTTIDNSNSGQQDVAYNLTYRDMGGDIKSSSFPPTQSDFQARPNMSVTEFGDGYIIDGSADLSMSVMPKARFNLVINYENVNK